MFGADDDDTFSTTTSASHLANLFAVGLSGQEGSPNLTYTAPKQPPRSAEKDKQKPQSRVVCAKTVELLKNTDSTASPLGKHGIAIIGDADLNNHNLLIYKTKQNIITAVPINSSLTYTLSLENSATFNDSQNKFWTVIFDNTKDFAEFAAVMESKGATIFKSEPKESINEVELSDGSQARADILHRISKVGQSMLPTVNKNPDLSDTDQDEVVKMKKVMRKPKRHSTSDKDTAHNNTDLVEGSQFMVPVPANQYPMMNGQYGVPQNMQLMSMGDPFSVHFAENRMHNSEVRMNLTQLTNKLDSVLTEMSLLKTQHPPETVVLRNRIEELEKKLMMMNQFNNYSPNSSNKELEEILQNVTLELEECKNEKSQLEETIARLNEKIEADKLEIENIKNSRIKDDAVQISEERLKMEELENLKKENDELKNSLETHKDDVLKAEETIKTQNMQITDLKTSLEQLQTLKSELEKTNNTDYENLRRENADLITLQNQLQEKLSQQENELKAFKDSQNDLNAERLKRFAQMVKDSMNTMYQNILEKCTEDDSYNFKKLLSHHMKNTTFHIIQEYESKILGQDDKRNDEAPPVPEFEVTV